MSSWDDLPAGDPPYAGRHPEDDPVIPYRLHGADFRMLACRADPDPRFVGCEKIRVIVDGTSVYLCPPRVYAFLSDAGGSLAGLTCVPEAAV